MSHRNISGIADAGNIAKWSDRSRANSFHNSPTNKSGGSPNQQTKGNMWFTPRLRADETGPGNYPGAKQDRDA
jgi:hypothetical protein